MKTQFKDKFKNPIYVGDILAYVDMGKSLVLKKVTGVSGGAGKLMGIEKDGDKPSIMNLPYNSLNLTYCEEPLTLWDKQQVS